MDGRPTWTDCDESGDNVVPNVLSPRDLVSRPDIIDETVPHTHIHNDDISVQKYPHIFSLFLVKEKRISGAETAKVFIVYYIKPSDRTINKITLVIRIS